MTDAAEEKEGKGKKEEKKEREKTKGRIIIDTNFLFVPFYYKIDIFEELLNTGFEIQIPNLALLELEKIKRRKGKNRLYVDAINGMLKNLIESGKVLIVIAREKSVDEYIINELKKLKKEGKEKEKKESKLGICTNDKALKSKIREIAKKESLKNVFIISSRGKRLILG
jgi:rRNA-processing protein FCF1